MQKNKSEYVRPTTTACLSSGFLSHHSKSNHVFLKGKKNEIYHQCLLAYRFFYLRLR
jgi:hypothetical protein